MLERPDPKTIATIRLAAQKTQRCCLPPNTKPNADLFSDKDSTDKDICINGLRVRKMFGKALLEPCSVVVSVKDVAHYQERTHLVFSFMFPAPNLHINLDRKPDEYH